MSCGPGAGPGTAVVTAVVLWWVSCRVSTHTNYIPTTLPVLSVHSVQSSSDTDFTGCLIFNEVKQLGSCTTVDNVDNRAGLHAWCPPWHTELHCFGFFASFE